METAAWDARYREISEKRRSNETRTLISAIGAGLFLTVATNSAAQMSSAVHNEQGLIAQGSLAAAGGCGVWTAFNVMEAEELRDERHLQPPRPVEPPLPPETSAAAAAE